MVAGETGKAIAVMLPDGYQRTYIFDSRKTYIVNRAYLLALSTTYALLRVNAERLIGDEVSDEKATYRTREEPRQRTKDKFTKAFLLLKKNINKTLQVAGGLLFFLFLALFSIHIHKRKSDIALRHYKRETRIEMHAFAEKAP